MLTLFNLLGITFNRSTTPINPSQLKEHINLLPDHYYSALFSTNQLLTEITYHDVSRENAFVAAIKYRQTIGQIGDIQVDPKYRRRGIGKRMVEKCIDDFKKGNVPMAFAVTTEDHYFWKNLTIRGQKSQWKKPVHPSVTGGGYYFIID
jgi:ribosomal protein S18 acetylase RimI-like enzyme